MTLRNAMTLAAITEDTDLLRVLLLFGLRDGETDTVFIEEGA